MTSKEYEELKAKVKRAGDINDNITSIKDRIMHLQEDNYNDTYEFCKLIRSTYIDEATFIKLKPYMQELITCIIKEKNNQLNKLVNEFNQL